MGEREGVRIAIFFFKECYSNFFATRKTLQLGTFSFIVVYVRLRKKVASISSTVRLECSFYYFSVNGV